MKASELIDVLQQLIANHGDLQCTVEDSEFRGEHWLVDGVGTENVRLVDSNPGVFHFVVSITYASLL